MILPFHGIAFEATADYTTGVEDLDGESSREVKCRPGRPPEVVKVRTSAPSSVIAENDECSADQWKSNVGSVLSL